MMFFDPMYFIILAPGMILAALASWMVHSAYAKASQMPAQSGLSGAEGARMILDSYNLQEVAIDHATGFLGDHYDPRTKTLHLSDGVFASRSVAALGIAAHEAGHAVQDAKGYAPLKLRNGIVPLAAIGSNFSWIVIMVGMALGAGRHSPIGTTLVMAGIGLFSLTVLFQLINLPVEFDASRRAKDLLQSANMVSPGPEAAAMKRVLNAAALTYVAATLTAVLTLLYFLLRSGLLGGGSSRRD